MARIRTIKPSFFTSLTIADLPVEARLTFIGLWTHVDDEGRCVADGRLIKAAVWPLDDRTAGDVEKDLGALTEASLIHQYEVGGRRYLEVAGWSEHQVINRPKDSTIPAPPEDRTPPPTSGDDDSPTDHGALTDGSVQEVEQGTGNREGNRDTPCVPPDGEDTHDPALDQFEQWWQTWPARNGKKRHKGRALNAWRALTLEQRRRAWTGTRHYATSGEGPCDAFRFLRRDTAGDYPFDDWQSPATPTPKGQRSGPSLAIAYRAAADAADQEQTA